MTEKKLKALMAEILNTNNLKDALLLLIDSDLEDIAVTARELQGKFFIAEIDNHQKIYYSSIEKEESGEETEYLEHVMNVDENIMKFIIWFFHGFFEIKVKDIYRLAGKTYQQQKKR